MTLPSLRIQRIETDFEMADLDNPAWQTASGTKVGTYWSGEAAPEGRHFEAKLQWSDTSLYVRFQAEQREPLIVSDWPDLTAKTMGLWERDVCEIFIAPDANDRARYFEFEVAPTGEWVDLALQTLPDGRETDQSYSSGMRTAANIAENKISMAMKIGWRAFGKTPRAGDVWAGNLFRCVGQGYTRGYLAWSPTMTQTPNFHVPESFGEFIFVD